MPLGFTEGCKRVKLWGPDMMNWWYLDGAAGGDRGSAGSVHWRQQDFPMKILIQGWGITHITSTWAPKKQIKFWAKRHLQPKHKISKLAAFVRACIVQELQTKSLFWLKTAFSAKISRLPAILRTCSWCSFPILNLYICYSVAKRHRWGLKSFNFWASKKA